MPFMYIFCILSVFILLAIDKIKLKLLYLQIKKESIFVFVVRGIIVISFAMISIFVYKMCKGTIEPGRLDTQWYCGTGISAIKHLTIVAYMYLTGIIVLPIVLIKIFIYPKKILKSKENIIVSIIFCYCVIFMSAFLRKEIQHFYYYSRYLAPFIGICAVTFGIFLEDVSKKAIYALTLLSMVILVPFNYLLLNEKDDSKMEWETIYDVTDIVKKDSAVVIDDSYRNLLILPLKVITKADVYPVLCKEYLNKQIESLNGLYENIYFITDSNVGVDENRYSYMYRDIVHSSEDDGNHIGRYIIMPLEFYKSEKYIDLFKYNKNIYEYNFNEPDINISGFDNVEDNSFRWCNNSFSELITLLGKEDYNMKIVTGPSIPFDSLNKDSLNVKLYVNNEFVSDFVINKETGNEISLRIPKEYLNDGKNIIGFESETWSPSEYGSGDNRTLAFSVSEILFEKLN